MPTSSNVQRISRVPNGASCELDALQIAGHAIIGRAEGHWYFVCGKTLGRPCEDIVHVSDNYVAVIDGSSLSPLTQGISTGYLIAHSIGQALHRINARASIEEALKGINATIDEAFRDKRAALGQSGRYAAASAAIYSRFRRQLWVFGDVLLSIDGNEIPLAKRIDQVVAAARQAYIAELIADGDTEDAIIQNKPEQVVVQPILERQQRAFLNKVDDLGLGYSNIDGTMDALKLAQVIDAKGASRITLASDGYAFLGTSWRATEIAMRRLLAVDPCLYRQYPQAKGLPLRRSSLAQRYPWFDDRAWVEWEL